RPGRDDAAAAPERGRGEHAGPARRSARAGARGAGTGGGADRGMSAGPLTATPRAPQPRPAPGGIEAARAGEAIPLALRGVGKRWSADRPPVLDGVELELDLGTRTWIGGRNGAGKTTLMRIAAGLIDPDRGRAEVWGFTAQERRRRYQR